jgi:hypothetical protein
MSDQPIITATRADGGIALTAYAHEGDAMRVVLSPRRALLLGLDLASLATEGVFRLVAEETRPALVPGGQPAGSGSLPASK